MTPSTPGKGMFVVNLGSQVSLGAARAPQSYMSERASFDAPGSRSMSNSYVEA